MSVRRLAAAVAVAGALAVPATPAAATCYIGQIDICDKPTDPYTDPVFDVVTDIVFSPPIGPIVGDVSYAVAKAYGRVLCLTGLSTYC